MQVKKKKKRQTPSTAPLLVPVLGSPASLPASAPGVWFGARGKCHLGAGVTAPGVCRSGKGGAGGVHSVFGGFLVEFPWVLSHGSLLPRAEPAGSGGRLPMAGAPVLMRSAWTRQDQVLGVAGRESGQPPWDKHPPGRAGRRDRALTHLSRSRLWAAQSRGDVTISVS